MAQRRMPESRTDRAARIQDSNDDGDVSCRQVPSAVGERVATEVLPYLVLGKTLHEESLLTHRL